MSENKEELQKPMIALENILLERFLKRDVEIQRNHEHKEKHVKN